MTAGPCLGDVAAALVDGELDHAARERAQRHLAHCASCRTEVEAQRRLKARLAGLTGEPDLTVTGLTTRLLQVALHDTPVGEPAPRGPLRVRGQLPTGARRRRAAATAPDRPGGIDRPGTSARRAGTGRPDSAGTAGRTGPGPVGRPLRARRRALAGTTFVALGLLAAFALGAPQPERPTTPLDPGADSFVAEFVSTTTVQPATGAAVPTSGGVGSPR